MKTFLNSLGLILALSLVSYGQTLIPLATSSGGGGATLAAYTFTSPPGSPVVGQAYLFGGTSGPGVCSGTGGSNYAVCVWTGSGWAASSASSTGGTGNAAAEHTVTFSASPALACASASAGTSDAFKLSTALTSNVTISSLSGCTNGQFVGVNFTENATGGFTVTMPSGVDQCPINTNPNAVSNCSYWIDGSNAHLVGGSYLTPLSVGMTPCTAVVENAGTGVAVWPSAATGSAGGTACNDYSLTLNANLTASNSIAGATPGMTYQFTLVNASPGYTYRGLTPANIQNFPQAGINSGCWTTFLAIFNGTNFVPTGVSTSCDAWIQATSVYAKNAPAAGFGAPGFDQNFLRWATKDVNNVTVLTQATTYGAFAPGACPGAACVPENLSGDTFIDTATSPYTVYVCLAPSGTAFPACVSVASGAWQLVGGANSASTYWTASNVNPPTNGVNLGALTTGPLKITVAGGVATPATAASADIVGLFSGGSGCTGTNLLAANGTCQTGGGLADPTANGVVFRSALNTTRVSTYSDIVGLFATCSGTQYLGADGNCHTASGSGTVTTSGSPVAGNIAKFSAAAVITPALYSDIVALWTGCSGTQYLGYDGNCHTAAGSGTVQSVTFTGDGIVDSATPSSAVTTTGTVTATPLTQTANTVLAGPATGSAVAPTFRAMVTADLPSSAVVKSASNTYTGGGTQDFTADVVKLGAAPAISNPGSTDVLSNATLTTEQAFANTNTTLGAATTTTVDGVHKSILVYSQIDLNQSGTAVNVTLNYRAGGTSGCKLWGTAAATNATRYGNGVIFMVTADGVTAGSFYTSSLSATFAAINTTAPWHVVCGAAVTAGAYTVGPTITFGTNTGGSAVCGSSTTGGTSCAANNVLQLQYVN